MLGGHVQGSKHLSIFRTVRDSSVIPLKAQLLTGISAEDQDQDILLVRTTVIDARS